LIFVISGLILFCEKIDGNTTTKTLSSNMDPSHVCNFRIVIDSS